MHVDETIDPTTARYRDALTAAFRAGLERSITAVPSWRSVARQAVRAHQAELDALARDYRAQLRARGEVLP